MKEPEINTKIREIKRYSSSTGTRIYCIPIESLPSHYTNVYLVLTEDLVVLIDLGSGWGDSNVRLKKGFEEICKQFGEKVTLKDVDLLLITHGHFDHFGGLPFFRSRSDAKVGIHELDARQVLNFEEAVMDMSEKLGLFLGNVGVSERTRKSLQDMYLGQMKEFNIAESIDFYLYEQEDLVEGVFRIYHTPGHSPGAVCIRLDDVLFTGDHLMYHISTPQFPEAIEGNTGLGIYLASLKKVEALEGLTMALGGHHEAIEDPYARIEQLEDFHKARLDKILEICCQPHSMKEISSHLFGLLSDYKILLALGETGAHVEYLCQQGSLIIDSLEESKGEVDPVLYYRTP